ncbi:9148_t:CDS:1 [Dentiscutata erythropus]|uniref:9148_t:CDS:1 n=1 Tax=Dentiscutata erythropus TaxID=1348616 RepID=A0A9N9GEM4_9GLOM|nr:9148_t:CDS:1 [Dentiscutata erythropus]
MELNITDIMAEIHQNLPNDWDLLFIGHCYSGNTEYVANLTAHELHKRGYVQCTHTYAVSAKGAKKLLEKININDLQKAIDLELRDLMEAGKLIVYSIHPSIVVQIKGDHDLSDAVPGAIDITYPLMNSTIKLLNDLDYDLD